MKKIYLASLLFSCAVLPPAGQALAQGAAAPYWFEVTGGLLLLKSAASKKPVSTAVALPNGTHLDYHNNTAQLADGSQVTLHEGDAVSLNGDITYAKAKAKAADPVASVAAPVVEPAPAPAPAVAVAPVAPAAPAPAPAATFTYMPAAPVAGKLKGVVELGASGFNSFIVRVDGHQNWKLEKSEFGNSLVMENLATDVEVRQDLKACIGKMLDYGVGGRDIYFMVSSGALKSAITPRIIRSLKEMGYVVNTVTPEREGILALRTVLPASYASKAFVVDIGSANTKVSWLAAGQPTSAETYGAKYYEKNTPDETVTAAVKAQAKLVPAAQRQTCFIIGGLPYELAKKLRKGQERYTVLDAPDSYKLETAKGKSGINIYRAVAEATGCKQFVFDWDSNFTIGYLLSQVQ